MLTSTIVAIFDICIAFPSVPVIVNRHKNPWNSEVFIKLQFPKLLLLAKLASSNRFAC